MDRIEDSGSSDWGSTPHGRTNEKVPLAAMARGTFIMGLVLSEGLLLTGSALLVEELVDRVLALVLWNDLFH